MLRFSQCRKHLRAQLPIIRIDPNGAFACPFQDIKTLTWSGIQGVTDLVSIRVRGVVELLQYRDGDNDGSFWQIGGSPFTSTVNFYKLTISNPPQVYYLNRGVPGAPFAELIDYTKTIAIAHGATVTLEANSREGSEISNGNHIVPPGIRPSPDWYNGQFVDVEFERANPCRCSNPRFYKEHKTFVAEYRAKASSQDSGAWSGENNLRQFDLIKVVLTKTTFAFPEPYTEVSVFQATKDFVRGTASPFTDSRFFRVSTLGAVNGGYLGSLQTSYFAESPHAEQFGYPGQFSGHNSWTPGEITSSGFRFQLPFDSTGILSGNPPYPEAERVVSQGRFLGTRELYSRIRETSTWSTEWLVGPGVSSEFSFLTDASFDPPNGSIVRERTNDGETETWTAYGSQEFLNQRFVRDGTENVGVELIPMDVGVLYPGHPSSTQRQANLGDIGFSASGVDGAWIIENMTLSPEAREITYRWNYYATNPNPEGGASIVRSRGIIRVVHKIELLDEISPAP